MNYSIYSADRRTHLKSSWLAFCARFLSPPLARSPTLSDVDLGTSQLVKAGQPTAVTGQLPDIR